MFSLTPRSFELVLSLFCKFFIMELNYHRAVLIWDINVEFLRNFEFYCIVSYEIPSWCRHGCDLSVWLSYVPTKYTKLRFHLVNFDKWFYSSDKNYPDVQISLIILLVINQDGAGINKIQFLHNWVANLTHRRETSEVRNGPLKMTFKILETIYKNFNMSFDD